MNLRNYVGDYNIGLDLGTGSVGWAVVDERGRLLHFKKQPTWGSRLFDSAQPASEARIHRGQRRRYVRRRWRLDLLQTLFKDEMDKVDPGFFERINHSRTVEGDPIFTGDFTKADYYAKFPTIYHLRSYLMETDEPADLRLIYLAIHNIVKYRGNFLREEEKGLKSKDADPKSAANAFFSALGDWCESHDIERSEDQKGQALKLSAVLQNKGELNRSGLAQEIVPLVRIEVPEGLDSGKFAKALANAMVGLAAEFKDIFGDFPCEKTKASLGKEEELDALKEACPDDCADLLESLQGVYSAYVLQGLLSYAPGKTISANMIAKYEQYTADLAQLKDLVKEYRREEFDGFFRGPTYHSLNSADPSQDYSHAEAQGYTAYNLHKTGYDDFKKTVEKLFVGTGAESDKRYADMMDRFDKQRFLRRLKTSDNGAIYYQLHLEELVAIIKNQGKYYPFLKEDAQKLESLVSFRIPYYVGPLTSVNARKDSHGKPRFQWSERRPGMEQETVTPWNWEQVINKNKSAENFILRMTGDCTYLAGEKTLPKCSLLYEEFCLLNELNGMRYADGGDEHRFDIAECQGIVEDLFHRYRRVTYARIEDWLRNNNYASNPRVGHGQGESALESKLGSYLFFTKDVFGIDEIEYGSELYQNIETIILWSTLFEDRTILEEKLQAEFGAGGSGLLNDEQIKSISKKRFTGWGKLSERFLTGLKVEAQDGRRISIMDVLREGDPNSGRRRNQTMVLMEALRDENLGFQKAVDAANRSYYAQVGDELSVNELPGSPAIRRSLNQAIRIVDEIVGIAGHAPANIFIENTRDEDERNKGKRTKKRYERLKDALAAFKNEDPEIWKEIQATAPADMDERLTLYFMQRGRCMYSRRPINIDQLSNTGLYEVDHIIPRAYIKDDSFENKALVYREENQRKTDELLLDEDIRRKMSGYWRTLHDHGLIGDKKFNNLLRCHITDQTMKGFVARQLVETSQTVKLAQSMLEVRYSDSGTHVVPVKASMSHNLREAAGLIKCREANDFHHAHDAFLACRIGLFIQMRHPGIYDNPIGYARVVQKYMRSQAKVFNQTHQLPGSAGFVINSFMTSGFDKETGEVFQDAWDAEAEVDSMRKALNYRQCYISRMPQEDSGAFWNATIYSPRNPKMGQKLALATKQGLDPKQYGGFSSQQFAYFFIYEAKKKGKPCFQFAEVPVWLAGRITSDPFALSDYARQLAEEAQLEYVAVTRAKLLKKQLIEIDGDRFVLTGKKEMRNATELSFSDDELRSLTGLDSRAPFEGVLDRVLNQGNAASRKLMNQIHADELRMGCEGLDRASQELIVNRVLLLVNGAANMVDLTLAGGTKYAGCLQPNYTKLLNDPGVSFFIIDQSVTGMFERKTRVGL